MSDGGGSDMTQTMLRWAQEDQGLDDPYRRTIEELHTQGLISLEDELDLLDPKNRFALDREA